ncbi:MAG: ABC transporter transmembrane domain-containing protein [Bacteroidota bacterium]|nr:ABC transporter transmembrane domain-containing protein [Bacteroidota bacterium]
MASKRGRTNTNGKEEEMPKAKITRESLRQSLMVFDYVKPYRVYFWLGLLFIGLSALSTLLFPFLLGLMIDVVDPKHQAGTAVAGGQMTAALKNLLGITEISRTTVLFLIIGQLGLQMIFSFMRVYMLTQAGERSLADLRKSVFSKILTMPMNFFSQRRVGELSSRITADLSQIQDAISSMLAEFLRGIITLVAGLWLIFYISPQMALVMLAVVPVIAVLAVVFGVRIRKKSKEAQDQLADTGTIVHEAFQAISIVKAFTNEGYEGRRYGKNMDLVVKTTIQNAFFRGLFISGLIFSVFGAIGFVVWYGVGLVQAGDISVGDLVKFVVLTSFVGGTMAGFADMFSQLQKTIGATQRVREILREKGETIDTELIIEDQPRLRGDVAIQNISFNYPSRPDLNVLNNISFAAEQGQQIAIVGPSGTGKSTVTNLLLGFYNAQSGHILIDGKPSTDYPLTYLRSQMALVPQDVILFGGTIGENILYGRPTATKDEVEEAAKKANAHNFITQFPEGYNTIVGERGVQLSGGQRQRVAIARAILKNPAILILDEATSSLDSESEQVVQEALDLLMQGRTSFVIAHRLSTIRNAHQIVVIDKGTVAQQGTHNELYAQEGGLYRNLYDIQFE